MDAIPYIIAFMLGLSAPGLLILLIEYIEMRREDDQKWYEWWDDNE